MSAVVLPPSSSGQAVRIEEADDPGLALASQVAFDLIDLLTAAEEASTPPKKAPHLPGKKAEGEPGLLKSEEGESHAPSEPISDLPASLLQLGDGRQQQNQVLADEVQVQGAVASGSSSQSAIPASRRIAERLRAIGDEVDKEIRAEARKEILKLFDKKLVYTISRDEFKAKCHQILMKCQQQFTSGWEQILVIYEAMRHIVTMVRQGQAEDASVQIRQQQVGNFVAPTLADLELLVWANDHGGLQNFGEPVQGNDKVTFKDSSVDPE